MDSSKINKILFSLLLAGHYFKKGWLSVIKSSNIKKGLFIPLFIFLGLFPFIEDKSQQSSLLAKATISNSEAEFFLPESVPQKEESINESAIRIAFLEREDESSILMTEGDLIVSEEVEIDLSRPLTRTEIEVYEVQEGDTLYSIAEKFGLKIDSLLWENNLTLRSIIKPGQSLKILPVDGLTHKVKKGETLESIARKYKSTVENIVEFNNLADASDIFIDDELILPYGRRPPVPRRRVASRSRTGKSYVSVRPEGKNCRVFVPGQCTYYVATRRCIPWAGHAKSWLANAQKMGFQIGSVPQVGAVISLRETGWAARRFGHVGYVESFTSETVTFSEMNFERPWVKTIRTLDLNSSKIIGYIY